MERLIIDEQVFCIDETDKKYRDEILRLYIFN